MPTAYPTSLDDSTALPSAPALVGKLLSGADGESHVAISGTVHEAILALETKLGITGSAVTSTLDYLVNHLAGDATGTLATVAVVKLRGHALAATAPTDGQLYIWNNANSDWEPHAITASGDATGTVASSGALALTLKNTGPGATGPVGSTTVVPVITIDGQGRVTALTTATIALPASAITSGTMSQARLGTGSDGSGTHFLADDQTYKTVAGDKLGLTLTAVKTANYTAAAGDMVRCDLAAVGSFTVTFPTAPTTGTVVGVKVVAFTAGRTLTIQLGGSDVFNVAGGVNSATIIALNQSFIAQYNASDAVWVVVTTDGAVTPTNVQTFTNKRITARIASLVDAATVTVDVDSFDGGKLTTLSQATLLANPTGTPTAFQTYRLRIKSTTARALTYGSQFRGGTDIPLPTTTSGGSLTDYFGFQYNSDDTKWDLIAFVRGY